MIYVVIYILAAVGFQQLMRVGQVRGAKLPAIVGINYVFAAAMNVLIAVWLQGSKLLDAPAIAIVLGCVNGILYVAHLLVLLRCFSTVGLGISNALVTMSTVIPVLASWLVWGESISGGQWVGIALMPVAAVLVRRPSKQEVRWTWKEDGYMLGNFLLAGAIGTISKKASLLAGHAGGVAVYQMSLFISASVFSVALMVGQRLRPSRLDVWGGVVAGALNAAVTVCLLLALAAIPAAIVLPTGTCSVILVNLVLGYAVWKERLLIRQFFGISLAIGTILLVVLG